MAEESNIVSAPNSYEDLAAELEAYDKAPVEFTPRMGLVPKPQVQAEEPPPETETPEVKAKEKPAEAEAPQPKAEELEVKAETEDQKAERERDEKGRFVTKKESEPKAADESPDKAADAQDVAKSAEPPKPDITAYEKAKKEAERKDRSWKALEEEKRTERAAIAAEKAALEAERKRIQAEARQRQPQERRDAYGNVIYPSHEYFKNAKAWTRKAFAGEVGPNGEDYAELATKAEEAGVEAQQREYKEAQEQFAETQRNNALEVMKNEPELADQSGPLAKELQSVFSEELERAQKNNRMSVFQLLPDGFWYATEVAKMRLRGQGIEEMKKALDQANAEISRLNKLTSVNGSSPTRPSEPKSFEDMSTDEQLKMMDRQVRAAGYAVIER